MVSSVTAPVFPIPALAFAFSIKSVGHSSSCPNTPPPGPARILPPGFAAPVTHAALLMASWSMVLDFDDVMLGGHTGHSSVLVPLAVGSAGGVSGAELILAQIVAN